MGQEVCPVCEGRGAVWEALVSNGEVQWAQKQLTMCPKCGVIDRG